MNKYEYFSLLCNRLHGTKGIGNMPSVKQTKLKEQKMPREFDATNTSSIALWSDDGFQVFGYELEVNGLSVSRSKQVLRDNNLTYCWVTSDSTDVVDAEIVFPPLPNCDLAWDKIREVMEALENAGARVGLVDLGGHVHISARRVLTMDMVGFTYKACELAMQSFE